IGLARVPAHDAWIVEHAQPCAFVRFKSRDKLVWALVIVPARSDDGRVEAALRRVRIIPEGRLERDPAAAAGGPHPFQAGLLERMHLAGRERAPSKATAGEIGDARHQDRRALASSAHWSRLGAAAPAWRAPGLACARRMTLRPSAANSSSSAQLSSR